MRIISTVPSQTELLADLGLDDEVIGITKFCVHPTRWFQSKTRIGGTKTLNLDKIKSLKPDLIIANKEENIKEQIEDLNNISEVFVSDIKSHSDNLDLIKALGELTGRRMTALRLAQELDEVIQSIKQLEQQSAAYLIWQDPYMTAGGDTYIHSMLERCGLQNVFKDQNRYPVTSLADLKEKKPDHILLSSEPFPFKDKQLQEIQEALPESIVSLVDGEIFSWYGTRLIKKVGQLNLLLGELKHLNKTKNSVT